MLFRSEGEGEAGDLDRFALGDDLHRDRLAGSVDLELHLAGGDARVDEARGDADDEDRERLAGQYEAADHVPLVLGGPQQRNALVEENFALRALDPHLRGRDALIVTNEVVGPLYLGRLRGMITRGRVETVALPDGERSGVFESVDDTGRLLAQVCLARPVLLAGRAREALHRLLPALLRAGALRFWVSRLWDFHLPREASMLKPHDPTHFERVLRERIDHPWHALAK